MFLELLLYQTIVYSETRLVRFCCKYLLKASGLLVDILAVDCKMPTEMSADVWSRWKRSEGCSQMFADSFHKLSFEKKQQTVAFDNLSSYSHITVGVIGIDV